MPSPMLGTKYHTMLTNIVDGRKNRYAFKKINAVVEATWHDNSVEGADFSEIPEDDGPSYGQKEHVSLAEAITWANEYKTPVTLYLYDHDGGIYEA